MKPAGRPVGAIVLSTLALAAISASAVVSRATDVQPGIDLWQTPPGASSHDFGGGPIPADFFNPGSDPFEGVVRLQGAPLQSNFGLQPYDTVVLRPVDAVLPDGVCPAQDTIPIEIVALRLVSSQPITVTFSGTGTSEQWDVEVCLSDQPQPQGSMTIRHECPEGGTYDSSLPVVPKFVFTNNDGPDGPHQRVLDCGDPNFNCPPIVLTNPCPTPWVHVPDPIFGILTAPPGIEYDGNCDGAVDPGPLPGTSNFVPGVAAIPCTCTSTQQSQQKRLTGEAAVWAAHGVVPAEEPEQFDSDEDRHGDLYDNCPFTPNPDQADCDCDGIGDVCDSDNSGCEACCLPDGSCAQNVPAADCAAQDGVSKGPGTVCQGDLNNDGIDETCFSPPCAECGPGDHFIHDPIDCPQNGQDQDTVPSGAVLGLDLDFDCVADVNSVLGGPATIRKIGPLDDSAQFPGLRAVDGHTDVVDTEIIAMNLTGGGGVSLVAGGGLGAMPLDPTLGAVAELPAPDTNLAESFFDVNFEVELGGTFYYNDTPIRVGSIIDCLPPDRNYIHITGCTPLYATPNPAAGEAPIANLVAANHFTYPGCCSTALPAPHCAEIPVAECEQIGGTVVPDCLGDNDGTGLDDACEPKCEQDPTSPTGCTNTCPVAGQECLPSSYGCDPNNPGSCGVLDCDCDCRMFFDAANEPFCEGTCPDGITECFLIGDGSLANPYDCSCDVVVEDGACCLPDGTCVTTTNIDCADQGGSFHSGVGCSGVTEACCFDDGTCQDLERLCCEDLGGTPQGTGTDCSDPTICGGGDLCPLPSGFGPWCDALQTTDCQAGAPGDNCWPVVGSKTSDGPNILACDCLGDACGPMDVTVHADGSFTYRCLFACPDTTQPCVIHRNGVPTTASSIHSSQFSIDDAITCDCKEPPPSVCPLEVGQKICEPLQATDCQTTGTGELCLPDVVFVGQNFQLIAERCDCFIDDGSCGPVKQDGDLVICEATCDEPGQACVIWRNGVSTGLTSAPISNFAVGDALICDCDPVEDPVCPLPPTPWCQNLQTSDCKGGTAEEECEPRIVSINADGGIVVKRCECNDGDCGPVSIQPNADGTPGGTLRCTQKCDDPVLNCVIHRNGVPTNQGWIHSSNAIGEEILCDCAPVLGACCHIDAVGLPTCTDGITQAECNTLMGTFHPGANCTGPEACCFADGSCEDLDPLCCADAGGVSSGAGVACGGAKEACCDPLTGACSDEDPACCLAHGGIPQGAGTDCTDPNVCGGGECPLTPGEDICAERQGIDCVDGQVGDECKARIVIIGPNFALFAERCECFRPDGTCGPMSVLQGPAGPELSCENECPDPNQQCVIWRNGVSTGLVSAPVTSFNIDDSLICDCDPISQLCPLNDTSAPWCQERQSTDCETGIADQQCEPRVVSVDDTGNVDVLRCDCVGTECGPVSIVPATNGFLFRCPFECPDPNQKCVIHRDGNPTGVSGIHSGSVAPGEQITCDCVGTEPQFCPLDPDFDICAERQQEDCQTDGDNQLCKARIVSFDEAGNPVAKLCDCFTDDGTCGPVTLFPAPTPPGGWDISCEQQCPDPNDQCVIWRNGVATTLVNAHSSAFAPGDELSCGCNPISQKCEPTPDGTACTQCPTLGQECVPTVIKFEPNADPQWRIIKCDCTDKCHIEPPPTPDTKPRCAGPCPNSPISLLKKCVRKKDPLTGGLRCRCVPILPPLDPVPVPIDKIRFISMSTSDEFPLAGRGTTLGPNMAVRITMDSLHDPAPPDFSGFDGEQVWAGEVVEYNNTINPPTTFDGANTSCEPNFTDFSDEFSVYGAEILPLSSYSVQAVDEECADSLEEEDCYSDPLVLETSAWGDIVGPGNGPPDGSANVLDIAAVVDQVKGLASALGKVRTYLKFNAPDPDDNVNVLDIGFCIDAVKGLPYPFSGPCTCPSSATCPTLDACGRCEP